MQIERQHKERGNALNEPQIAVDIRLATKPGSTRAHADVRLHFPDGELILIGFAIIEKPGKAPWVAFPQNRGQNRYFDVIDAKGRIRDAILKAVLSAYELKSDS